jgi:hypothetical protein
MKKLILLFWFICIAAISYAQPKIGLRFAPNLAFNSVPNEQSSGPFADAVNNGVGVRFSAGPIADFFFAENYAFSTGLWYTLKRSAVSYNFRPGELPDATINQSVYNLQYLQIPATLKLFTNEVAPDVRLYFQFGTTVDIKLAEKPRHTATNFLFQQARAQDRNAYRNFDFGLLAAGAEMYMGEHTAVFGGISYNRGLINTIGRVDYAGERINNNLRVINNVLALELGIKF